MEPWQQKQQDEMLDAIAEKKRDFIFDQAIDQLLGKNCLDYDEDADKIFCFGHPALLIQDCVDAIDQASKSFSEILYAVKTMTAKGFHISDHVYCSWWR